MPPIFSDDEMSVVEDAVAVSPTPEPASVKKENGTGKKRGRASRKSASAAASEASPAPLVVENEEEEDEDEDEADAGEDVYVIESIKRHVFDEDGTIRFHVKWEGYDKPTDMTWEPEENLESAKDVLNHYYNSIGGRDYVFAQFQEEQANGGALDPPPKKKRGRASTAASTPTTAAKKARTSKAHPRDSTPPKSITKGRGGKDTRDWQPPTGSWEEDVVEVEAMQENGENYVYLTWRNGKKTQHPIKTAHVRCPQVMLRFYEKHLVFKQGGGKKSATPA